MFKNFEDYQNQRNDLLNLAQELLNAGKIDEANAKTEEVAKLDNAWDDYAKAQANLNALNGTRQTSFMQNMSSERGGLIASMDNAINGDDLYNSIEYRNAFMNHVLKGVSIPTSFQNANANTKTTDAGSVIPTTVMEKIIEKIEAVGMIYNLVTKTAYKGGLTIPTSSVKPVASWVAEGAGSDKQKKTTGSITFAYHKLRCAISVSLEVDTMALSVFESTFIANVSQAMVKALEQSIVSGTGTGQPKGFLTETPVAGQSVEIPEGTALTYAKLVECEAALPLAYENDAVWFMTKKTFMAFVGMTDTDGQPIARVNYGIAGKPERSLLGRTVVLNDYMASFTTTVTADTIVAALFNPKDYVLNTNLNITIKKYEDNDTDDQVTKAVMLVDGKVVDVNSLVTLKIKNV